MRCKIINEFKIKSFLRIFFKTFLLMYILVTFLENISQLINFHSTCPLVDSHGRENYCASKTKNYHHR